MNESDLLLIFIVEYLGVYKSETELGWPMPGSGARRRAPAISSFLLGKCRETYGLLSTAVLYIGQFRNVGMKSADFDGISCHFYCVQVCMLS